jgi:hypothetical protein
MDMFIQRPGFPQKDAETRFFAAADGSQDAGRFMPPGNGSCSGKRSVRNPERKRGGSFRMADLV